MNGVARCRRSVRRRGVRGQGVRRTERAGMREFTRLGDVGGKSTTRTSNRRVFAVVGIVGTCAAFSSLASPVAAASPQPVSIISPMSFNPDGFNSGTFEASGSAVDAGLICESGTVDDTRIIFAGWQSRWGAQIPVRKTFTCDDDSGTFFVKIQVHLDFATATESISWVVQGGTGAYEDLRGSGGGSTVSDGSDPQTGNINTYVGFLVD
jgi:hypothetical protein